MDIKDSYLHGTVGVVKSISVNADKLSYKLADIAGTVREVTLPVATLTANGLLSKEDKNKLDNMVATRVANDLILKINSGTTEGTSLYTYNGSSAKTLDIKSGTGIGFTNNAGLLQIYNSGVRSIATGTTNGTISVNTNGTSANVAVKGLGSAAYTNSSAYAVRQTLSTENLNNVTTPGFYNCGGGNTCTNKPEGVDHFGMYVIHCAGGTYYVQILFEESDSARQWRRHCINDTWSSWALDKLSDTTYSVFTGATASADGTSGLVPKPTAGNQGKFLKADGTWATPANTTYSVVSNSANGLAPKVINTNTATVGTAYYVLASSDGSATPSWYKLPSNAFVNDDTKVTQTNTTTSASYRVLFSGNANDTTETTTARKSTNLQFNPNTGILSAKKLNVADAGGSYISGMTNAAILYNALTALDSGKYHPIIAVKTNGEHVVNFGAYINQVGFSGFKLGRSENGYDWRCMFNAETGVLNTTSSIIPYTTNVSDLGTNSLKWKNVYATTFVGNLDGTYVNKLTGYSKATSSANLAATDSLNTALGKLEYKADTAYSWYRTITEDDTDNVINKWDEVVDFVNGLAIDLTDEFVTRKTNLDIIGLKRFVTNTNEKPLIICRNSGTSEALKIGVNDSQAIFDYDNDEKSCSFVFKMANTDVEGSDGNGTNTSQVTFVGSASGSTISADTLAGKLNSTLTFSAGAFSAKTYNNSAAVTVNIPTHTSHLTNNSGYLRGYTRSEVGTSPNFDDPGINGVFEVRNSTETAGESGTKPFNAFGPMLSVKAENVILQIAAQSLQSLKFRSKQSTNVTLKDVPWRTLLDSVNYTTYTVKKDGTGATGTWDINISGVASKVCVNQHTENDIEYPIVWTNQNNTSSNAANQLYKSHGKLSYNPKHNRIAATTFKGNLEGNIKPFTTLSFTSGTSTVKNIKDALVTAFLQISTGVGANVIVPAQAISLWNDETKVIYDSNVYSMIKIGGGYESTAYGLWLLSTYSSNKIGYVGRDANTWGSIYWLARTIDIPTKLSQLTNDSGFLTSRGYIGTTAVQASSASQNLTGIGNLTMSGNLTITPGNTDNFINFSYSGGTTSSWRLGYLGTGSGDGNYLVIQSAKAAGTSWNNVIRMGNETLDAAFGGNVYPLVNNTQTLGTSSLKWSNVYATTFTGNLSGNASSATTATRANYLETLKQDGSGWYGDQYKFYALWGSSTILDLKCDGYSTRVNLAKTLDSITAISAKAFSLSNASWTDTGYTFASLASGTYAVQVTSGSNLVASGIMSVYKNLADTAGDEIPLHVYGTAGWRPYLRTYDNKLLISSNDVSATSRTVTIKIAQIL